MPPFKNHAFVARLNEEAGAEEGAGAGEGAADKGDDAAAAAATAAATAAESAAAADPWSKSAPEGWREELAGEDEDKLKRLGRYTDFNSFLDSSFEAHEHARKGITQTGLPENPTEEQLNEYREANGIPTDGKYELSLEEGAVLNEQDKAIMEKVFPVAQASNIGTAEMSAITSAFVLARDEQVNAMLTQDSQDKQTTDALLRSNENWGHDFETNTQMIENLVNRLMPEANVEALMNSRDGDGKMLFNNPAFLGMMANIERTINPMSTIPGGQENANDTARQIVNQAKEWQKKVNSDSDIRAKYNDPTFQKSYDQAIEYLQSKGEKI